MNLYKLLLIEDKSKKMSEPAAVDSLFLGLIANRKKMSRSGSTGSFSGAGYIKDAFQIFEAKVMNNEVIKTHPKEFADFLTRNIDEIIGTFERRQYQRATSSGTI